MPVIQSGSVNLAALSVNDVYIVVATPISTSVQGVDTGIVGLVGGASWGPLNVPVKVGSPKEAAAVWGPLTVNPNDLMTDAAFAYQQGILSLVGVRVGDGTQDKADTTLVTASKQTVTIAGTPAIGDTVTVTIGGVAFVSTALVSGEETTVTTAAAAVTADLNANETFAASYYATSALGVITVFAEVNDNAITFACTKSGTLTVTAGAANMADGGTTIATLEALYTGTEGNNITATLVPGSNSTSAARTWTLKLAKVGVAPVSELFVNLPESTLAASMVSALANGQSVARGPSKLARATAGAGTTPPAQAGRTMTGGVNGDTSITSSQQLGTNAATPSTGMYAMEGQGVQQFTLCGNTSSTTWSAGLAFAQGIGALFVMAFPASTDSKTAIAAKKAGGGDNAYGLWVKDWVQVLDTQNDVLRLISPAGIALGKVASMSPEQSPGNKPVVGVLNTERTLAEQPYLPTEVADLTNAGINFITNPVPGGNYFALRHGLNGSSNNAINDIPWTRMTNFIAYSLNQSLGEFIDMTQSAQPGDPTRDAAETKLRNFFRRLKNPPVRMIDDFSVDMSFGDSGVNTAQSVSEGYMIAEVRVKYLGIVRKFIVTLLGGKTVDVKSA
jgi:hypothetical protein